MNDASSERWVTRDVAFILVAQTFFGFAWSLYLLIPKFQAVALGAGPELIGRTSAVSGIAGVLTVPFAATGIDRLGRKLFFRIGCALVAALSFGYLFVDHVGWLLFLLQGLVAAAFVLAFNASAALMADWAPPERLGQAIGLLGAANVCMNAIATAVAEPIADRFGWHAVFELGLVVAVLAFAMSFGLRAAPVRPTSEAPLSGAGLHLRGMRPLLLASLLAGVVFTAVFTFIQPFAIERGAREVRAFFLGFTVAAVACRVLIGDLGDRLGRARVSRWALLLYSAAALLCTWLEPSLLWLYGFVFGTAHGVLYPTLNALVLEHVRTSQRGLGMALYNGAFNVGMAVGGFGWGLLGASRGYASVFLAATLVGLLAAATLLSAEADRRLARPG